MTSQIQVLKDEILSASKKLEAADSATDSRAGKIAVDELYAAVRKLKQAEKKIAENPRAYDPDDPYMQWVVALAHAFKKAKGFRSSPIVPDVDVIVACLNDRSEV